MLSFDLRNSEAGKMFTGEPAGLSKNPSACNRKSNEEAAAAMPKGKLIHIDGAVHNLHHDKLEPTMQVLKEFVSTL